MDDNSGMYKHYCYFHQSSLKMIPWKIVYNYGWDLIWGRDNFSGAKSFRDLAVYKTKMSAAARPQPIMLKILPIAVLKKLAHYAQYYAHKS